MIEIREEGGCEMYNIYINDLFFECVSDNTITDEDLKLSKCNCYKQICNTSAVNHCTCKCHGKGQTNGS